MRVADRIRVHGREKYVVPARSRKERSFSIRTGDVLRELKMSGLTPAICSALKTNEFLQQNNLKLVDMTGPKSGQSTTVVYTYEFIDTEQPSSPKQNSWASLRGALKDVFAEMGGGEAYLRAERESFSAPTLHSHTIHAPKESK